MIFDIPTIPLIFCLMSPWKRNAVSASKVYFEDITVVYVNDSYIDKDTLDLSINYKPNSMNTLNVYVDAIKEAEKEIYIRFSVATRSLGYEIPTGVGITNKLCTERVGMAFFEKVLKPFGVKDCPPKKGSYGFEDFDPDFGRSAFLISGAHLSLDLKVYAEDELIIHSKTFVVA